ncbi:MAG: hypothetical protein ACP5FR_01925 [Candidatus Micrarchaeia archaeon]
MPKSFYNSLIEYINTKASGVEKINGTKMLADLFEERKQKMLLLIAYKKQLPDTIDEHELNFYNSIVEIISNTKLNFGAEQQKGKLLKVVNEIPEIILPSGKKIGPLKKDEIINSENISEDVNFLLSSGVCERL